MSSPYVIFHSILFFIHISYIEALYLNFNNIHLNLKGQIVIHLIELKKKKNFSTKHSALKNCFVFVNENPLKFNLNMNIKVHI